MDAGGFTDGAADSKGPAPVFGNIGVVTNVIIGDRGAGVVVILDPIDGTAEPSASSGFCKRAGCPESSG